MDTAYYGSVLIEALVVGALLAAMLAIATVLYPIDGPQRAIWIGIVVGALTHLLFEVTKANRWYCTNGAACKSR
jgi:hypothetical protein